MLGRKEMRTKKEKLFLGEKGLANRENTFGITRNDYRRVDEIVWPTSSSDTDV